MTQSDKLLYAKLTKLGLSVLAVITLVSGFVKLVQIDAEKTIQCIENGHNENFCRTGEGPRY